MLFKVQYEIDGQAAPVVDFMEAQGTYRGGGNGPPNAAIKQLCEMGVELSGHMPFIMRVFEYKPIRWVNGSNAMKWHYRHGKGEFKPGQYTPGRSVDAKEKEVLTYTWNKSEGMKQLLEMHSVRCICNGTGVSPTYHWRTKSKPDEPCNETKPR
jgi:hypothetical protein